MTMTAVIALLTACGSGGHLTVALVDAGVPPDSVDVGDCPGPYGAACSALTQMGCCADHKCTWALATEPTTSEPGLGAILCKPDGSVKLGGACANVSPARGGYDNCIAGTVCVANICEAICDDIGGMPRCSAAQMCVAREGLFANVGAWTIPAGVCEPTLPSTTHQESP